MAMYDTKQMGMQGLGGGAPAAPAPAPPGPDLTSEPAASGGDARAKLMAMPQEQLVDIMVKTFPPDILDQALSAFDAGAAPGPAPVSAPPAGGGM